jgi:hypothetical protein
VSITAATTWSVVVMEVSLATSGTAGSFLTFEDTFEGVDDGLALVIDVRGGDLRVNEEGAVDLALERDAAVGFTSRSIAPLLNVVFLTGGGGRGVLRDLARDAAVGANKLGVFERVEVGVLTPASVRAGVFGVAGILEMTFLVEVVVEATDWPVC